MGFFDDVHAMVTMPIPGPGVPEEWRKTLDAMPMQQLAGLWCSLQYLGLRDQTLEVWNNILYFDSLPHDAPERALEMVLTVLRSEAHKSVKMELNAKLMATLVYVHGVRLVDEIEAQARGNPQLRWLLGGAYWNAPDGALKARLGTIVDEEAWQADEDARDAADPRIDFTALPIGALARAWVAQKCLPHKDQGANAMALCDYEGELKESDQDRMVDLVLEILKIEADMHVLSYLAAGLVDAMISARTIDRIERVAAVNEDFRVLLRGAGYWNEDHEIKRRLDAITGANKADA
jgi:Family of unknown function (DUF6869)